MKQRNQIERLRPLVLPTSVLENFLVGSKAQSGKGHRASNAEAMPPNQAQLASFTGLRAFGIAGGSRAMSPEQMARELPPAFKALKASGALFIHYKTCSTFVLVDVLKLEAERSGKVGAEIAEKLRSLKWR